MDKKHLQEWLAFGDGAEYSRGHFYTLLMEDVNETDAALVFSRFERSEQLCAAFMRIRERAINKNPTRKNHDVLQLVLQDLQEKARFCKTINNTELFDLCQQGNVYFLGKKDFFASRGEEKSWPMWEVLTLIGDEFINKLHAQKDRVADLIEPLYGATYDYHLVWYVLSCRADVGYDFEAYVTLQGTGSDYFLSEEGIYVLDMYLE